MADPALALQAALVALIRGLGTAAGMRVYDVPPSPPTLPYITVGPAQVVPTDEDCFDASQNFVQIDIWSTAVGFPEVKAIGGTVRAGLHDRPLSIEGHVCDRMFVRTIDYSRDPDGLTSRARIDLEVDTEPSA